MRAGKFATGCPTCSGIVDLSGCSGLTKLADSVLSECTSLSSVSLPSGLKSIGDSAFYGCSSLASLTIPAGVESLGSAFIRGTAVGSLTIPASVKDVPEAGSMYDFQAALYGAKSLTSVALAPGTREVPAYLLATASSLRSVSVPSSVTSIGAGAFRLCSSLADVYYYGDVSQKSWDAIKIGNYNEPLKAAKLHFVKQPVASVDYGVVSYEGTSAEDVRKLAHDYEDVVNDYLRALQKSSSDAARAEKMKLKKQKNHGEVLESLVAASDTMFIELNLGLTKQQQAAAYQVLARYFDAYIAGAEGKKLFDDLDVSADGFKFSAKMVRSVRNAMTNWDDYEAWSNGHRVEISPLVQFYNKGVLYLTVDGLHPSMVVSKPDATAEALTAYIKELKEIEENAIYQACYDVSAALLESSGISNWTKSKLKGLFTKGVQSALAKKGFGPVLSYATDMWTGCDALSDILKMSYDTSIESLLGKPESLAKKLQGLDFTYDGVTDKAVGSALDKVNDARDILVRALFDYAAKPGERADGTWWKNTVEKFKKLGEDTWKKLTFQCPVDVYVYDAHGNSLGEIVDGEATFDSRITMRVDGDVKTVAIPASIDANIKLVGTGIGEMTYVEEQVVGGKVTGRANWYGVSLSEGCTYEQPVPSTAMEKDNVEAIVSSDGGEVGESEYIPADDSEANVQVALTSTVGGTTVGEGRYAKGSPVDVRAYPASGYDFEGWYKSGTFVSSETTYRFAALEDTSLEARFSFSVEKDGCYVAVTSEECEEDYGINVMLAEGGNDDIMIGVSDLVGELPASIIMRTFVLSKGVVTEKSVTPETRSDAWLILRNLDLRDAERIDFLLPDGTRVGSIYPAGGEEKLAAGINVKWLTVAVEDVEFDGSALKPAPVVKLGSTQLKDGVDYTLKYRDNVNVGTANVTITRKGQFTGTKSATFKIVPSTKPQPEPSSRTFPDVKPGSWYYKVVGRAAELGLVTGYSDGTFGPDDSITRGQVAVILWRMAGQPKAGSSAKSFSDVTKGKYYYDAVRWASGAGVVSGYASGKFGPDDKVTREQLAVMLSNYASKVGGLEVSGSRADFASMRDAGSVAGYAQPAVGWCFRNKILSGSQGNVLPKGNATRAQAAKMLVFLYDMVS